ncbi:DUF1735 domain-containing protein [Desertivirga arenae]|uniref:DUF1735 domain-containing protein n=1 Tax=Desertivirga arenae TaxID=2810309 RepID=UPI001A97A1AF|nr:DUF1735 domain-containing protein [Pedobacter sp. SYSU D00823]
MKRFLKVLPIALICFGLSSCLKDEPYTPDTAEAENIIELSEVPETSADASHIYATTVKSFQVVPSDEFDVIISYSGSDVAPQDIVVDLETDFSVVDKYNAKIVKDARDAAIEEGEDPDDAEEAVQGELFDKMPSNLFSLSSKQVTIKKGEKTAIVKVTVTPNKFDFSYKYGLPISIKSASYGTVSGNFNSIIYAVGAKNKWDGNYEVTATAPFVDLVNPLGSGWYPLDADLITVDANSVVMASNTYLQGDPYGHPFKNNGGNSYYGNFSPIFTMDDNGNVIRVTNYYGQGGTTNGSGRSARLNPSGVNKFTTNADGSKTLEVSYIMQGPGFVDRTFFHEKWVFKGAR